MEKTETFFRQTCLVMSIGAKLSKESKHYGVRVGKCYRLGPCCLKADYLARTLTQYIVRHHARLACLAFVRPFLRQIGPGLAGVDN